MTVWNLGSINIDLTYRVPHIPAPGETLAATGHAAALGGKGANQSVAAARAGATVHHIGAIGPDSSALFDLAAYGVDVTHVARLEVPTGQALITVDDAGENAIVLFPGANRALTPDMAAAALAGAAPGDLLLMQNETSAQAETAALAHRRGLRLIYSAAPFDPGAVRAVVGHAWLLAMNEGEAAALRAAMGSLPPVQMIVTRGARGAEWIGPDQTLQQPAFPVTPVDTTGAGDTFIGWLAASLDLGLDRAAALRSAAAAAAIQVTRPGAAPAIPSAAEVAAFLTSHPR